MKKLNLWLAIIASILFFFGNYFKVQHWPGASVLMVTGAGLGIIFSVLFLFSDLGNLSSGCETRSRFTGGITMIFVLVAFVFKIMNWPGATVLVYIAHGLLLIFSIMLMKDAFDEKDASKQIIKAFSAFCIFTFNSILILLGLGSIMG